MFSKVFFISINVILVFSKPQEYGYQYEKNYVDSPLRWVIFFSEHLSIIFVLHKLMIFWNYSRQINFQEVFSLFINFYGILHLLLETDLKYIVGLLRICIVGNISKFSSLFMHYVNRDPGFIYSIELMCLTSC